MGAFEDTWSFILLRFTSPETLRADLQYGAALNALKIDKNGTDTNVIFRR